MPPGESCAQLRSLGRDGGARDFHAADLARRRSLLALAARAPSARRAVAREGDEADGYQRVPVERVATLARTEPRPELQVLDGVLGPDGDHEPAADRELVEERGGNVLGGLPSRR